MLQFIPRLIKAGVVLFLFTMLYSGCGGGVTEEQMQMLFDCRAEVESLQAQVNARQDERASIQRQIADRDSRIRQLQSDLQAVRTRCP